MNRLSRELAFLTAGILTCTPALAIVLVLFVVGVVTSPLLFGLPVLVACTSVAGWFADLERDACERAFPGRLPGPAYRRRPGRFGRLLDPQAWRDVTHGILGFAVLLTTGLVGLCWTLGAVALTSFIAWEWALPRGDVSGLYELATGESSRLGEIAVNTGLGLLSLALVPVVVHAMASLRLGFSRALLTTPASALRARSEGAEAGRGASTRARA